MRKKKKPSSKKRLLFPKHRMAEAQADDARLSQTITNTLKSKYQDIQERSRKPFDGLLGTLPSWVPLNDELRFNGARDTLLTKLPEADIRKYVKEYQKMLQGKDGGRFCIPLAFLPHISTIYSISSVASLDPEDGLRLLAGDYAVAGYRTRTAYTKRKEFQDKPKVQQIGREEWSANPKATIKDVRASARMCPFTSTYASRTLESWLSAVDPRSPAAKCGRPKIAK